MNENSSEQPNKASKHLLEGPVFLKEGFAHFKQVPLQLQHPIWELKRETEVEVPCTLRERFSLSG